MDEATKKALATLVAVTATTEFVNGNDKMQREMLKTFCYKLNFTHSYESEIPWEKLVDDFKNGLKAERTVKAAQSLWSEIDKL